MNSIFKLKAENSSGIQNLHINKDNGEVHLTLTGKYRGKDIQIDFDSISQENANTLAYLLKN